MTKDKERDDALIAEKERLADILEKKAGNAYYAITSVDLRQAAAILRGDEQPALKPDRAEVLFDKWFQTTSVDTDFAHEDKVSLIAVIRRHFDELRAEWEAERSDEPVCLIGKVDCDGNELVTVSKDALDRYKDQARYTYQRAEKAEARVKELEAERPAVVVVPREEQIKQMVTRFLGWKLPEDFHPDDGISFEPFFNVEWNAKQGKPPQRRTPTGTNLFTSTQAEAMVRYMLGDDT